MTLSEFIERKLEVVAALHAGRCGGSYVETCILLSGLISGMAAHLWPGQGFDRKRFVELWIRYGHAMPRANLVSVPLLVRWLRQGGRVAEAQNIEAVRPDMFGPGYTSRVLTDVEVDMTEAELKKVCSTVTTKDVRLHAYPPVFYEHVRSSLVHEYKFGEVASEWPMTGSDGGVSYVNIVDQASGGHMRRQIHFHVPWLMELTRSIAREVENSPRASIPNTWWLLGG